MNATDIKWSPSIRVEGGVLSSGARKVILEPIGKRLPVELNEAMV
jgi:hypothetical protein